jgi:hypothetical protein
MVVVAVALTGLLAQTGVEAYRWGFKPRQAPIDSRFVEILPLLSKGQYVGYVSDMSLDNNVGLSRYYQAQYAVAPRLLIPSTSIGEVLADFSTRDHLDAFLKAHGFRPKSLPGRGPVLLERIEQP